MPEELTFTFDVRQRERFRNSELVGIWSDRYPNIFDDRDIELALNQPQYHFFEWLSAVLLFEATGYLSLLENYTATSHPKKLEKYRQIVPQAVFDDTMKNQSGLPDLFCYAPSSGDWMFSEVKGGPDRVRDNQDKRILEIEEMTNKSVWIINLKEIKT